MGGGDCESSGLIHIARRVFPNDSFKVCSAVDIETNECFDHVVSHSMFQYLTLQEASIVIRKMISKAKRTVGIFDIPDETTRAMAEKIRRENTAYDDYQKRYAGLEHTYYSKQWLLYQAELADAGLRVEFIKSQIDNNPQSPFRFGMVIYKDATTTKNINAKLGIL